MKVLLRIIRIVWSCKAYSQQECIDYIETFSLVEKMNSIRLILSLAANFGWKIHHMDVKSFILNGGLSKQIYMEQPPSFVIDSTHVCRLQKSLYGLK